MPFGGAIDKYFAEYLILTCIQLMLLKYFMTGHAFDVIYWIKYKIDCKEGVKNRKIFDYICRRVMDG